MILRQKLKAFAIMMNSQRTKVQAKAEAEAKVKTVIIKPN